MSSARASTACSASSPSARMVIFSPFLASPVIFRTLLAFTSRSPFRMTTCEENPLAVWTNPAGGRCQEPRVRRDGNEAETFLDHTRGVFGSSRENAGGEAVLACGRQYSFDGLEYLWFFAVRARSVPEVLAEVRGSDEDRIQPLDTDYLLQVIQRLLCLDHGHGHDSLVRVFGVVLAAVECRPVRTKAAISFGRVAAGPDESIRFLAGVDHGADHRVAPRVEHAHDEAGIVPQNPDDGHGIRRGDGLQHGHEALVVHGPVLHVDGEAVPARVRHHLGGERDRNVQPPVHHGSALPPDTLQTILPHPCFPSRPPTRIQ